ncbi:hypothetical protein WH47_04090 [Habropoda laboriosa]|uniref:Uncharacterized protein n=1 Tax=Habropoda laboriosa TaxID=597456 RepID=A0A0L7QXP2_9HYME|nr:hypothetical protein WH47_04090 [Habropoda laboriosa]
MGSGQSARMLTIDNEEIGVIAISESVVERLTQQMNEKNAEGVKKVRSATLREPSSTDVESPQLPHNDVPANFGNSMHYPQVTLTALMMHQQKEQELRSQDNYWQKRLQNLEKKHSKINDIIDAEYKKAAEELYVI